jgi:DNA processing protein
MMTTVLYTLTHIASQLLHRWLPPPLISAVESADEPLDASTILSLEERDWLHLIHDDQSCNEPALTWFSRYQKHIDRDGLLLARTTHQHLRALTAAGGTYVPLCDPRYPIALRQINDPPMALSICGDLQGFALPAVSVVGSRKASALAMHASFDLGRCLASKGFLVVSGGAFGCDIAAHHGVLASQLYPAPAACIFAGGLATLYPRANEPVFQRLRAQKALLISERLWTATCRPVDFTARNRIISGLGAMTVLMQAATRSGALVTARLALDQGRDVAVMRHPIGDVRASGSAALLYDGAWGFDNAEDFLGGWRGQCFWAPAAASASQDPQQGSHQEG